MIAEQIEMLQEEIDRKTEEREASMEKTKHLKSQIAKLESAKKTLEGLYA